jgi:hypothetical protein
MDDVDFGRWSGQTFEALLADPQWRIRSVVLLALQAPIDDYSLLAIGPASLTRLTVEGSQLRLDSVNERIAAA